MPLILIGEHGSHHAEELLGIAVGFGEDEDEEPRVVMTTRTLTDAQRELIAAHIERLLPQLRAGRVGATH